VEKYEKPEKSSEALAGIAKAIVSSGNRENNINIDYDECLCILLAER